MNFGFWVQDSVLKAPVILRLLMGSDGIKVDIEPPHTDDYKLRLSQFPMRQKGYPYSVAVVIVAGNNEAYVEFDMVQGGKLCATEFNAIMSMKPAATQIVPMDTPVEKHARCWTTYMRKPKVASMPFRDYADWRNQKKKKTAVEEVTEELAATSLADSSSAAAADSSSMEPLD
jgi:hypothetical protein